METQRDPVSTEYRGIQFRSKSEACFAAWLDWLKDNTKHGKQMFWDYEPPELIMADGYQPDFRCIHHKNANAPTCSLIEYKPLMPTSTYIETTLAKLNVLAHHAAMPCDAFIFSGSFWQNDGPHTAAMFWLSRGSVRRESGWLHGGNDDLWHIRQRIAKTRFDLSMTGGETND
jgi:hypothetical protein